MLDAEKDFLAPFRTKTTGDDAYTGLGKLIDAAVKFAAYTKDGRCDRPEKTARPGNNPFPGIRRVYRPVCGAPADAALWDATRWIT